MSKRAKRLQSCRRGCEFSAWMDSSPEVVRVSGAGDHRVYYHQSGDSLTIDPAHYEYPKYTRREIIRAIMAIGFTALAIGGIVSPFII